MGLPSSIQNGGRVGVHTLRVPLSCPEAYNSPLSVVDQLTAYPEPPFGCSQTTSTTLQLLINHLQFLVVVLKLGISW